MRRVRRESAIAAEIAGLTQKAHRLAGPGCELARREIEAVIWQRTAEHIAAYPFITRSTLRSEQWREALEHVRDLGVSDLIDFALQQSAIAANKERGVPDMRPLSRGSCHKGLADYSRMRAHKAAVVRDWLKAAIEEGADLTARPSRVFTSEMRSKPKLGNPLERRGSLWEDD